MISYPDVSKNNSMYTDLARRFYLEGHNVFVAVANGNSNTKLNTEGEIQVLRIKTGELFGHYIANCNNWPY